MGNHVYIFGRLKKVGQKRIWGHLGVRKWARMGTTKKYKRAPISFSEPRREKKKDTSIKQTFNFFLQIHIYFHFQLTP